MDSFFTKRKPLGSGVSGYGFADRLGPMAQYKSSHNPRTDGTMNVSDAINDGQTVMPWLPSSGVGPSSEGYRGSYDSGFSRRGYGHGGGGRGGFSTGRPTARTADEFYKARDLTIGNPIEELKMHGPKRDSFVQRAHAEAGVGGVAGAVQGTDAYYAGKGLGPDGKTPLGITASAQEGQLPPSQETVPDTAVPLPQRDGYALHVAPVTGVKNIYSKYGTGNNIPVGDKAQNILDGGTNFQPQPQKAYTGDNFFRSSPETASTFFQKGGKMTAAGDASGGLGVDRPIMTSPLANSIKTVSAIGDNVGAAWDEVRKPFTQNFWKQKRSDLWKYLITPQ